MISVTLFTKDDEYSVYLDMTADAAREMLSGTGRRVLVDGDELKMLHIARIEDWNWEVREWDEGETFGVRVDESDVGFGLCPPPPSEGSERHEPNLGEQMWRINELFGLMAKTLEDTNFRSGATEDTRMESPDLPELPDDPPDLPRSVTFVISGTDAWGNPVKETIDVPADGSTVRSRNSFATIGDFDDPDEKADKEDPTFQGDTTQAFDAIKRFI